VSDVLLGVLAAALLAGAGLVVATTARILELPQLVLAAYVVAFAEIVGLVLVLSAFEAVTRRAILIGLAGMLAAAVLVWLLVGSPRPPRPPLRRVGALGDAPEMLVLALATGLALVYVVALIVGMRGSSVYPDVKPRSAVYSC
jgi:hypothetical protein